MRRLIWVTMLLTLFPHLVSAQTGLASWDNLNRLQAGQEIQVVQMDMKSLKGTFLGFTEEALSLRVKIDEVAVPREEVLRVSLRGKPKRSTSALVGAALGAGLGAVASVAACASGSGTCGGEPGLHAFVGAIVGAGAGAGLGAAVPFIPSSESIYRVER